MDNAEASILWLMTKDRKQRNRALKAILKNNSGIIYAHHKKVINKWVNLDDFKQDAGIQAMDALDRFDPTHGFKFQTFFAHLCNAAVHKTNKASEVIRPRYGPKKKSIYDPDLPPQKGETKNEWKRTPIVSMSAKNHDGETIEDVLKTAPPPEPSEAKKFTDILLKCLNPKQLEIVCHYYGIGRHPKNLRDIADMKRTTHQGVQQALAKALKQLQKYAKLQEVNGNPVFKELSLHIK